MAKKSVAKSADLRLTSVPAFRPVAMAATTLDEGTEPAAKNPEFVEEEITINEALRPKLSTPNRAHRAPCSGVIRMKNRIGHPTFMMCLKAGQSGCG